MNLSKYFNRIEYESPLAHKAASNVLLRLELMLFIVLNRTLGPLDCYSRISSSRLVYHPFILFKSTAASPQTPP